MTEPSSPAPTGTLLSVRDLAIHFGPKDSPTRAVDSVSFDLDRGKTMVLVGESGSGKSLTSLSILRLLPHAARIASGHIALESTDILSLPESKMREIRGKRVGMIFQEPQSALNPVLTIGYQIGEVLKLHLGLRGNAVTERVVELLEQVGIDQPRQRANEYPHQYSGGMKQRAMIAMAIAAQPDLLIADEPTTALDVTTQDQVLELIESLKDRHAMGILFITHDLAVASRIADEIAVMQDGKIVERGQTRDFFQQASHAYTRQLLDAIPSTEHRLRDRIDEGVVRDQPPVLRAQDLKVHYPIKKGILKRTVGYVKALDGVTLDLYKGETFAIVGESGSGKTTMGKGILNLVTPTAGRVYLHDTDLGLAKKDEWRRLRSELQIVFQDPVSSMNPRMMVGDILKEGMRALNVVPNEHERDQRVEELLDVVGLEPDHRFRYPHEFSGGQRQRICIARALAVEPSVLVCDEPTSALDVSVQAQILRLLRKLQVDRGLSYLFVTHNIAVVEYLAHRVAVMYQGKIVEEGPVSEVLTNPQHSYTKTLLAAVPKMEQVAV